MNVDYFVERIFLQLRKNGAEDLLDFFENLPGRKPWPKDVKISKWYNELSTENKEMIKMIVFDAMDQALFGFFCILDHVGFIEDTEEKTTFELYAVKNGQRVLLNDPNGEELHNIYNSFALADADKE